MNKHKKKPMKPRYILWLIIILCLVFIGVSLNNNGEKLSIQKGISALLLPMEKGLNSPSMTFWKKMKIWNGRLTSSTPKSPPWKIIFRSWNLSGNFSK